MDEEVPDVLAPLKIAAAAIGEAIAADRKKWGGLALESHGRLGWAEIGQAFVFRDQSDIHQPTPLGMPGHPTPGEVGAARDHDPAEFQPEQSVENSRPPSPSDIAEDREFGVHGRGDAYSALYGQPAQSNADLPSPSDIAADNTPEREQTRDRGHKRTR
jgi:hypothetical protein